MPEADGYLLLLVVVVPTASLTISGPIQDYTRPGDSGKLGHRKFCSRCGSPICHYSGAARQFTAIKGGVLDKQLKAELEPTADTDVYGKDKLPDVPKLQNYNERMPGAFHWSTALSDGFVEVSFFV